jgi:L-threonylcarbamoyladenylate synthase
VSGPRNVDYSRIKLRKAARIVSAGGVIAYPTEAVFGLGCHPDSLEGVMRILSLKRREVSAGLILIAADREQLNAWIDPCPEEQKRLDSVSEQAVTWVVTAHERTPYWITGHRPTVAVRISRHPIAAALCRYSQAPLVSTSANRRGHAPATSAMAVRRLFGADLDYILSGPTGTQSRPSEIRMARTGQVLRGAG